MYTVNCVFCKVLYIHFLIQLIMYVISLKQIVFKIAWYLGIFEVY